MLNEKLKIYNIILASASPRRHAFLKSMNIDFEVRLKPIDEIYPKHLKGAEITDYLAKLKAEAFKNELNPKDILITSDTIVWLDDKAVEKPKPKPIGFNSSHQPEGTYQSCVRYPCQYP